MLQSGTGGVLCRCREGLQPSPPLRLAQMSSVAVVRATNVRNRPQAKCDSYPRFSALESSQDPELPQSSARPAQAYS